MAYPDITSGSIMDRAAALNNDPAKTAYTYTKQLPFLNSALQELQEEFELNDIPVTRDIDTVLTIPANTGEISFSSTPSLPSDLVEPKLLWERPSGIDPYVPMSRVDYLPQQLAGVEIPQFIWYVWEDQKIRVLPASQDNDIKINYTKFLFGQLSNTSGTDTISVINSRGFLEYRTGALIASLLAENPTRAQELNSAAGIALQRIEGIGTKGRQAINIRRRPFRAGWKRGYTY